MRALRRHRDTAEAKLEAIRRLAESWSVPDDVYLHLDGQDLGYADAAVQLLTIIDPPRAQCLRCGDTEPHQCARPKENR